MTTTQSSSRLHTGGLRLRVALAALGISLLTTIAVTATLAIAIKERQQAAVTAKLSAATQLGQTLDARGVSASDIASQVSVVGVSALVVSGKGLFVGVSGTDTGAVVVGSADAATAATLPTPVGPGTFQPPPGAGHPVLWDKSGQANTVSKSVLLPNAHGRLTVILPKDTTNATGTIVRVAAVAGGAVLFLAALILIWLVRVTLRPLDDMTDAASDIAGGDRNRRLNPDNPKTELGRAATAFDVMLDSLDDAVLRAEMAEMRLRNFSNDAAHELRTPVAALAATAENLMREQQDAAATEQHAFMIVRESHRAARILQDLTLALQLDVTGDSNPEVGAPALSSLAITGLVRESVHRSQLVRPGGANIAVTTRLADDVHITTDGQRVAQIIANLLDNALRVTPSDGHIEVDVSQHNGCTFIDVQDSGPGIGAADRERVFDRLVRLDDHRSRDGGGSGLGLSISRGLARSLGGDLMCTDPRTFAGEATPATGAHFVLTLVD